MSQTQEEIKTPKFCFLIPVQPAKEGANDLSTMNADTDPLPAISVKTPTEGDIMRKSAKTNEFPVNLTFVS